MQFTKILHLALLICPVKWNGLALINFYFIDNEFVIV
jgi:hypothetical protein